MRQLIVDARTGAESYVEVQEPDRGEIPKPKPSLESVLKKKGLITDADLAGN